jgi:hypothetical protein
MARYIRREQKERKHKTKGKKRKRNPTFLLLPFAQSHSPQ